MTGSETPSLIIVVATWWRKACGSVSPIVFGIQAAVRALFEK
jgi:hypothetical protein